MLKTIILTILVILTGMNFVLLQQIFRKMKQNLDKTLGTIEPYISVRLTAFGINMTIICIMLISQALLRLFFHA